MSAAFNIEIFDCNPNAMIKEVPIMKLLFEHEQITVRELIERRVRLEILKLQQEEEQPGYLIAPTETERLLNNKSQSEVSEVDIEKQCRIAITSFKNNGFFIIVDDQQIDGIDEALTIRNKSQVEFFRLTSLVGG